MILSNSGDETMVDQEFTIRDDFPPTHYEQWRELAEASLMGAPFEKKLVTNTYEGIDLQPVYTLRDQLGEGDAAGLPGQPPYIRGTNALGAAITGWDLRQEHSISEPKVANEAILADLEGGVTSWPTEFTLVMESCRATITTCDTKTCHCARDARRPAA